MSGSDRDDRRRILAVERELARALAPARLPDERVAEIRAALQTDVASPRRASWPLGAVAALVTVAVLSAWGWRRVPVLEPAHGEASPFEQAALAVHDATLDPSDGATLVSASTAEVRRWARTRTGVDLSLPLRRPPEDEGRFELAGVRALDLHGRRAVAVSYRVDGRPVTLAAAREADVPGETPAWTLASKRVRAHEVAGHRVLSWANDGQAYVLVADLPGAGLRSCLVCHTQPGRRRVIDQLER